MCYDSTDLAESLLISKNSILQPSQSSLRSPPFLSGRSSGGISQWRLPIFWLLDFGKQINDSEISWTESLGALCSTKIWWYNLPWLICPEEVSRYKPSQVRQMKIIFSGSVLSPIRKLFANGNAATAGELKLVQERGAGGKKVHTVLDRLRKITKSNLNEVYLQMWHIRSIDIWRSLWTCL